VTPPDGPQHPHFIKAKRLKRLPGTRSALIWVVVVTGTAWAAEKPIDVEHSTLRIHVGKSGLFSAAGHEHWVTAPIAEGALEDGEPPYIWFRINATKLTVEVDKDLSSAQLADVQNTMQTHVLDSQNYPEITFRSNSIEKTGAASWSVKGDLKLHGQTHAVKVAVRKQADIYVGSCQLKQTDFGIRPVTVAGGMVKVKDELQVEFSIAPVAGNGP
jgi:polyisoprenoid-binding protein YceI